MILKQESLEIHEFHGEESDDLRLYALFVAVKCPFLCFRINRAIDTQFSNKASSLEVSFQR